MYGNKIFLRKVLSCGLAVGFLLSASVSALANNGSETANKVSEIIAQASEVEKISVNISKDLKIGDKAEFDFTVQESGEYELELVFEAISRDDPLVSFTVDGEHPFEEAERLEFSNDWIDNGEPRVDEKGNEISPEQMLKSGIVYSTAQDKTGLYELPYTVNLDVGVHKVEIEVLQGEFFLKGFNFKRPENPLDYSEWIKSQSPSGKTDATIIIEGEKAVVKNDKALIQLTDNTTADLSPASPVIRKLNYIGGSNWSEAGETITWKFNCEKSGYYRFGFKYRQDTIINGVSYRHLKIDGKTPFNEASRVKFGYDPSWNYFEYGEEELYLIKLDEGEHTLSLSVTAGEISSVYGSLKDIVASLGDLYIDITMIVGETVDNYRSYELFNQIPDFNDRLDQNIKALNDLIELIEKVQEADSGSLVSNLVSAVETLEQMRNKPYSAHRYKTSYYTAYTNLSATLGTITSMPLDIDRIFLIGDGVEKTEHSVSLGKKFLFSAKRFFTTFAADYNAVEADSDKDTVTLWVNWGRDQAQVLNALIRESFEAQHDIDVIVKISNASLIQGILAGKGPDVMLHMSRSDPVNFAMRGALVDLEQFSDFDEVTKQFTEGAMVPYEYKGGTYALPDTQNFYVMFARTDILKEFGLEIPKTWDEFLRVSNILQRNNLQVSLPLIQITASTTVNVGVGGLTLYPTVLLQNGLSLYNDDLSKSTLTEPDQIRVFNEWCQWYTKYKILTVMDFYNRFRIGSAPLGISSYTLITQIKATAPEIEGSWTVTPLPGTVQPDGSIDITSAGSGSGCSITKLSKNPEAAWKFLKWWVSADTQVRYSNNLESYIGPLGRVATSSTEAFTQMGWDARFMPALLEQRENVKEIEEIPGGYYTARGIDQAFWNVIEQNKKPKDMLIEWGGIVDKEIERKCNEYK